METGFEEGKLKAQMVYRPFSLEIIFEEGTGGWGEASEASKERNTEVTQRARTKPTNRLRDTHAHTDTDTEINTFSYTH